jgi:predicted dehydrogenase
MTQRKKIPSPWNRRDFLKTTSLAAGALAFGVPTLLRGQNLNSKLNIACVGVMGKGESDSNYCADENIVALCDVAADRALKQRQKFSGAKFYQDFRRMFDEMGNGIDAVTVSIPDHSHGIVASRAMKMGKHVYCQKPLAQTIHEARYLRQLAHSTGVVTQMGNQGSAADGLRRAVECIHGGIIGQVSEVHIWTNRPIWPQGMERPAGADPVPAGFDWDLWLSVAPMRPYKATVQKNNFGVYAPFNWRGWLDFGTGALGDMACHTVNMPFRGLNLGHPTVIEAVAEHMPKESYPLESKIRFEFPARKTTISAAHKTFFHHHDMLEQSPVSLTWYDGGKPSETGRGGHDNSNKPPRELLEGIEELEGEIPNSACLLIGDQGKIFSPDDYGEQFFIKLNGESKYVHYKKHPAIEKIPQTIPRNLFKGDNDARHHFEWLEAIKQGKPELCYSRFDIGGQLAEIMLLGCVSLRIGKKIEWDGPNMTAKNCPEAAPFIKRENRSGWVLS